MLRQHGVKIPKFVRLKFDPDVERRARAPAVDQWRVEFPHLARAYDVAIPVGVAAASGREMSSGSHGRYPQRRGKGRGENRDALARSPTGGGRFVDGGEGDWSDHQSATLSGDPSYGDSARNLDDPMYDPEDEPLGDAEVGPTRVRL